MEVRFKTNALAKCANDVDRSKRELGSRRAKLYHMRLNHLANASTVEQLRHLPGHYHELSGDRRGQWSCDLDQPYRLIFEPVTEMDGTVVVVVEIVDYH